MTIQTKNERTEVLTEIDPLFQIPDEEVFRYDETFGAHHYQRLKTVVRKTEGAYIYTEDGRKILDCLAAYSSANAGHHHPKITQAVIDAIKQGRASVISNVVYTSALSLFLKRISEFVPKLGPRFPQDGNKTLPKNGGVESVETALKLARFYGWKEKRIADGSQEIIVFDENFHGRTISVISFSSSEKYKEGFGPLTPGFKIAEYGNLDSARALVNKNTCGILVEPMQGEGGMNIPPEGFLMGLREISDKENLLLIFDEIQVGLGRTGKNFCFEHENVIPDAVILGKALAGGLTPLSVLVTNGHIMDMVFTPGKDGSTFGGNSLACAAGIAALDVLEKERLAEKAAETGAVLKKRIIDIASRSKVVKEVRGRGLFIGIEVKDGNAMKYCHKLLDLDMLANDSHGHTIRISPPLIIGEAEVDFICDRLEKVLI
ncbi:MAG: aspartate aminotransferase family protein [candidate division Zixibacteria bacterium]|nr:aspartate aminotransferase family protein [candidate division Zixibacteria bacterium]